MTTQTKQSAARQPWRDRRGGRATPPSRRYPRLATPSSAPFECLEAPRLARRAGRLINGPAIRIPSKLLNTWTPDQVKTTVGGGVEARAVLINGSAIRTDRKVLKT